MTRHFIAGLSGLVILVLTVPVFACVPGSRSRAITFEECASVGGVTWRVDLDHPEICPACAEYRACEIAHNDYRDVCPECYGACQQCRDRYSFYDSCPECYGPCQACQNRYHHEFASDEERYERCPECEKCADCRQQVEREMSACPPCLSCNECKEANRKYWDIREVCPQIAACVECQNKAAPYPDTCPSGKRKIAVISDAAMWVQCCK